MTNDTQRIGAVFVPGTLLKNAQSVSDTLLISAFCVFFLPKMSLVLDLN